MCWAMYKYVGDFVANVRKGEKHNSRTRYDIANKSVLFAFVFSSKKHSLMLGCFASDSCSDKETKF